MIHQVYLLQPDETSIRWKKTLSRLGVSAADIKHRSSQTPLSKRPGRGILFADCRTLRHEFDAKTPCITSWIEHSGSIVVTGPPPFDDFPFPTEELYEDHDPQRINDFLLRHLTHYSRHLPRVDTCLPGLYSTNKNQHLCEITNIGAGGAFIKTGSPPPSLGADVRVNIALLGLRKEIELDANIVRRIVPQEENNYLQGFGVKFSITNDFPAKLLNDYVRIAACDDGLAPAPPYSCYPQHRNDTENRHPESLPQQARSAVHNHAFGILHSRD